MGRQRRADRVIVVGETHGVIDRHGPKPASGSTAPMAMAASNDLPWHARDADSAVVRLATDMQQGLGASAIAELRTRFGSNELPTVRQRSIWAVLLNQFR